jgi:diguanylate cyclase (GGDEF)-like protein/PAS domain S-box-containing protein
VLLDGYGLIEYANPAAERILGSSTTALIGRAADDLFRGQDGRPSAQMRGDPRHIATSQEPYEAFIEQTNGSVASVLVATAAREGGGAILTLTDLTLRKQFEAKLQRLAHYDALTNLANRPHFTERFEELAADLRNSAVRVAVLFIDLDGFKQINDTLGHAIGDQVLIETGKRIVNCVRARDLAARFGGDEFVVLLVDIEDEKSVIEIANRIVSRIAEPYLLPNRIETLSGSVGISISQPPNFDPETLISQADIAMYEAKRGLRANAVVYRPEMQIHIHRLA